MSVQISDGDRVMGYALSFSYIGFACNGDTIPSAEKSNYTGMSVMNLLGYIPGVSVIVGIARIIFSQFATIFTDFEGKDNKEKSQSLGIQQAQLVRGVLECCTIFSPAMLIADIACTIFLAVLMSSN